MPSDLTKAIAGARAAKARLEDMLIQEVSLVDLAANGRTLLVRKRAEQGAVFKALLATTVLEHRAEDLAQVAKLLRAANR